MLRHVWDCMQLNSFTGVSDAGEPEPQGNGKVHFRGGFGAVESRPRLVRTRCSRCKAQGARDASRKAPQGAARARSQLHSTSESFEGSRQRERERQRAHAPKAQRARSQLHSTSERALANRGLAHAAWVPQLRVFLYFAWVQWLDACGGAFGAKGGGASTRNFVQAVLPEAWGAPRPRLRANWLDAHMWGS